MCLSHRLPDVRKEHCPDMNTKSVMGRYTATDVYTVFVAIDSVNDSTIHSSKKLHKLFGRITFPIRLKYLFHNKLYAHQR